MDLEIEKPDFIEFGAALKTWRFYHMSALLFIGMFYGLFIASVYKTTAQGKDGLSDRVLTIAGAIGSVCNGSSRIMWATLQDKIGFKKVYFILLTL